VAGTRNIIMTLRVDFLHPRLDPRVYKEAKELLKRDYSITVLCWTKKDSGLPKFEEYEGIKIERIPHSIPPPSSSRLKKAPPYFQHVRKMAKSIKDHKPDLIHTHDTDTLLESSFAHNTLKVPFIFDSHEDYPGMVIQNYPLLAMGTKFLEKLFINSVDHVIAATAGIKKKFEEMGKETTLVYNSRPREHFINITRKERGELRQELGFDDDDFIVGYAGVMTPTHGTDLLLKSMPLVKQKNIKLLFIGGPPEEYERTQKLVKKGGLTKRAKVMPHMPFDKIMKYYQVMDAGTILYKRSPNYIVAAPNKLFEFMGYGIPILASDLPEMHTILSGDGEASILVKPDNIKATADAMEKLASDKKLCQKFSKKLKDLMDKKYNWELQRDKLYSVYDRIFS
jgi:glycosyltransferase involved in cell wall biosynthesis